MFTRSMAVCTRVALLPPVPYGQRSGRRRPPAPGYHETPRKMDPHSIILITGVSHELTMQGRGEKRTYERIPFTFAARGWQIPIPSLSFVFSAPAVRVVCVCACRSLPT